MSGDYFDRSKLLDELKQFIDEEWFLVPNMNETTRIEEDLGITGDDAVEFLIAFGKKFDVDISRFNMADYFHGEGWSFDCFFYKLQWWFYKRKYVKKVLTIGDLLEAIRVKRLGNSEEV